AYPVRQGQRGGPYAPRCPASKVGLARSAALRSAYRLSSTAGAARGPLRPTLPRLEDGRVRLRCAPPSAYPVRQGSARAPTPHAAPPSLRPSQPPRLAPSRESLPGQLGPGRQQGLTLN